MPHLTIYDAQGKVKEIRSALHAFGALHPFSFATFTAIAGLVVGLILG